MNTDRGLLFLTLCLVCFWLVFDDFFGKKRLSSFAANMTPSIPSLGDKISESVDKALNGDPVEKEKTREKTKKAIDKGKSVTVPLTPVLGIELKPNDEKSKKDLKDAVDAILGPEPS